MRRVMSTSSGFGPSSRPTVRGSSAMPQIGQAPGLVADDLGVHRARVLDTHACPVERSGSSAMPHFGHEPGWSWRTSGIHRAEIFGPLGRGGGRSSRLLQEGLGRFLEALQAPLSAEIVGGARVLVATGRGGRGDCHAADRVDGLRRRLARVRRGVMMAVGLSRLCGVCRLVRAHRVRSFSSAVMAERSSRIGHSGRSSPWQ